jgi:hypothetical protein
MAIRMLAACHAARYCPFMSKPHSRRRARRSAVFFGTRRCPRRTGP